mmetsp:Transcript_35370/g.56384  ORF Transcript_35370/g.56384 Transcript_35370/m.56384 type:complete len:238 (+) Transcript_35370:1691-2404(+)
MLVAGAATSRFARFSKPINFGTPMPGGDAAVGNDGTVGAAPLEDTTGCNLGPRADAGAKPSDLHTERPRRGKRCAPLVPEMESFTSFVAFEVPSKNAIKSLLPLRRTLSAGSIPSECTSSFPAASLEGPCKGIPMLSSAGCQMRPPWRRRSSSKAFVKTRAFTCGSTFKPCQTNISYLSWPLLSMALASDRDTTSIAKPRGEQEELAWAASSSRRVAVAEDTSSPLAISSTPETLGA